MINLTGKFQPKGEEGTIFNNPTITPITREDVGIVVHGVWQGKPRITIPLMIEAEGAVIECFNLDNIIIDSINFDVERPQDVSVLLGRIENRFNDFKVKETIADTNEINP